jgi:phosphomannomutase
MVNPKIFKAYDVRATYPDMVNAEAAYAIGFATAQFLKSQAADVKRPDTIVVGRDMRPSSSELARSLSDGIRAAGLGVIDVGMIDTSFIYFAINHLDAWAVSRPPLRHNPIQYNGFKISGPKAKPIGRPAAWTTSNASPLARNTKTGSPSEGSYHAEDLWPDYKKHVRQFLDLKRPLKVVVDASNGMAGKMVPSLFSDVPNLKIIPILFEITGSIHARAQSRWSSRISTCSRARCAIESRPGRLLRRRRRPLHVSRRNRTVLGCDLITALLARDFLKPCRRTKARRSSTTCAQPCRRR